MSAATSPFLARTRDQWSTPFDQRSHKRVPEAGKSWASQFRIHLCLRRKPPTRSMHETPASLPLLLLPFILVCSRWGADLKALTRLMTGYSGSPSVACIFLIERISEESRGVLRRCFNTSEYTSCRCLYIICIMPSFYHHNCYARKTILVYPWPWNAWSICDIHSHDLLNSLLSRIARVVCAVFAKPSMHITKSSKWEQNN